MNSTTRKFKLLVAEDETICQMALKNFAKKLDIDIDIAGNGQIALDKAKANDYDLVLMDMYMPELTGKEATAAIRKLDKGSKFIIVALSASEMTEDEIKTGGFNAFVSKPISKTKFEELVKKYR